MILKFCAAFPRIVVLAFTIVLLTSFSSWQSPVIAATEMDSHAIEKAPDAALMLLAKASKDAFKTVEKLITEQKFAAALKEVKKIRKVAQKAGDESTWTRALVKETQFTTALHGFEKAVRLLKGAKGTKVSITIERPGLDEPFDVTIERDEIPIQSVRVAYMVDEETGVVRIGNFNTTTADELDQAIEQLTTQGMQRLIVDLRSNPGGLLEQAVEVSERFIDPGKLIVYTQGRIAGSNQRFVARRTRAQVEMPLIVLVEPGSGR